MEIPVYRPFLEGREKEYVIDCIDSSWISSKGKYIDEFEGQFARRLGVKNVTSVSNGTVAIHLALIALGIGSGDEVIVPTLTYIASANAVTYTGATPVFVDSLLDTWQINPEDVIRKITSKTKAIMAVHLYGHPCSMRELKAIAKEYNLFILEDCAESFGTLYEGIPVGGFGDISTFSFYGNKTITTGEGGMVATNDETLYQRSIHFKGQGLAKHRQYWHDVIGYNYRMTNICAAIGLAQLEQIDIILKKKRAIANWYIEDLSDLPVKLHSESANVKHSFWMVSILVERPEQRDALRTYLSKAGIETRPLFYPVHTMPMYSQKYQRHPVAEYLGWRGINLPSWPGLKRDAITTICSIIRSFYNDNI